MLKVELCGGRARTVDLPLGAHGIGGVASARCTLGHGEGGARWSSHCRTWCTWVSHMCSREIMHIIDNSIVVNPRRDPWAHWRTHLLQAHGNTEYLTAWPLAACDTSPAVALARIEGCDDDGDKGDGRRPHLLAAPLSPYLTVVCSRMVACSRSPQ